jgi:hypothetical protein
MSDDRTTPLWPCILALLIGLPVLYVASFGPSCWMMSRIDSVEPVEDSLCYFYGPLFDFATDGPTWLQVPLAWWMELGYASVDATMPLDEVWGVNPPTITTREIAEMSENGASDEIIIMLIQMHGGKFDTSPRAVTALVDAGISETVIEAMRKATSAEPGDDE